MSYEARKREENRTRAQPGWRASVERFKERVGEVRDKHREASVSREAERDRRSREELKKLREEEAKLRTRKQVRETKGRVQRMRMEESPLGRLALGAAESQRPRSAPRPQRRSQPKAKRRSPPREETDFGFMGMNPFGFEPPNPAKRRQGKQRSPFEDWP